MIVLNMLNDILGKESVGCHYVPNAFLMSCLVFIGTFLISFHLKKVNRFSIMLLLLKYIRLYLPYSITNLSDILPDIQGPVKCDTPAAYFPYHHFFSIFFFFELNEICINNNLFFFASSKHKTSSRWLWEVISGTHVQNFILRCQASLQVTASIFVSLSDSRTQ